MTLRRWLALCGVAAPVLIVLAFTAVGGSTPDDKANAAKVVSYYRDHKTASMIAALMVAIGAVLLVLFAARLRELLRGAGLGGDVLSIAAFGSFSVLPVFWAMPTAFLSGTAAAAGVAYINSIANISGFVGNYIMGWLRDTTGSFDSGLLVIAAVCNVAAFATLCIHHDKEMELAPTLDDTTPVPVPGNVAEIV